MQIKYELKEDFQIKSYIMTHPISTENAIISYMTKWIRAVNKMRRNKKKYKGDSIRAFLIKKYKEKNMNKENIIEIENSIEN